MNDEQRVAVHEAGHAVVALALGLRPKGATIIAGDDAAGYAMIPDPYLILDAWEAGGKYRSCNSVFRGRVLAYMAGREAEITLLGDCTGGDGDDCEQITRMLGELPEGVGSEQQFRKKARGLVRRYRRQIERVANTLVQHRTLTADDITRAAASGSADLQ